MRSTRTPSSGDGAPLRAAKDGLRLAVWALPGRRRTALAGVADGRLRVQLAAPAVDGRANRELLRFLAGELGLAPSALALVTGESGRRKTVAIAGLDRATAAARLGLGGDES